MWVVSCLGKKCTHASERAVAPARIGDGTLGSALHDVNVVSATFRDVSAVSGGAAKRQPAAGGQGGNKTDPDKEPPPKAGNTDAGLTQAGIILRSAGAGPAG